MQTHKKTPSLLHYYHQIMRSFRLVSQYQYGRKRQLKSSITYCFWDTGHLITVTLCLCLVLANLTGLQRCCTLLSFSLCWGQTLPATLLLQKKISVLGDLGHFFMPVSYLGTDVSLKVYLCCKQSNHLAIGRATQTEGPADWTSPSDLLGAELE